MFGPEITIKRKFLRLIFSFLPILSADRVPCVPFLAPHVMSVHIRAHLHLFPRSLLTRLRPPSGLGLRCVAANHVNVCAAARRAFTLRPPGVRSVTSRSSSVGTQPQPPAAAAPPPPPTWVDRAPARIRPYLYLARIEKPIGTLLLFYPCSTSPPPLSCPRCIH